MKYDSKRKKTSSEVFFNAFAPMDKGLASPIVKQLNNLLYPRGYTRLPIPHFSSGKEGVELVLQKVIIKSFETITLNKYIGG